MHYLSIVILVLFNGDFEWFLKFLRVSLAGELTRARENRLARGVATRAHPMRALRRTWLVA